MDNCFLIDWFSATCHLEYYDQLFGVLGIDLSKYEFVRKDHSLHGFRSGVYHGGISIYFDNSQDDTLVWVEMSGSGCRTFEEISTKSFSDLLRLCYSSRRDEKPFFHLSRVDVAYDIFDDPFLFDRLKYSVNGSLIVSGLSECLVEEKSKIECGAPIDYTGRTIYFGSPRSELRFRLYDKRLERMRDDVESWYRFEIMLRNDRAAELAYNYCHYVLDSESLTLGNIFCSYLDKYLSVRDRGSDSNPRRWRVAPWWSEFIKKAVKLRRLDSKPTSYNIYGVMSFVQRQAGNSIDVLLKTIGVEGLSKLIRDRQSDLTPEQISVINEYHSLYDVNNNSWGDSNEWATDV